MVERMRTLAALLLAAVAMPAWSVAGVVQAAEGARDARPRIPVAAATIYPGEVISRAMLRMRAVPRRYYERGGFVRDADEVVGKMARRTLVRGRPIPPSALREPYAVRSGKAVRIVYRRGGLEIVALGTALASASAGEVVPVRNVDSGRIIRGVARADGTVQVGGP